MAEFTHEELLAIGVALLEKEESANTSGRHKRKWVHNAWQKRSEEGEFATLYPQLMDDENKFYEYFRMSKNTFNLLLTKTEDALRKKDTRWRLSVKPKERLAVCLRFLATGDSYKTISFSYRLGHSTIRTIVNETCRVLVETLMKEVMALPTKEGWKEIAEHFSNKWNFPNCLGAIDGKHVTIQAPANSGSQYYNYKKTFSVVLLALVDANCNFIAVDVGAFGKNSDGGIFSHSNLGKSFKRGTLNIPEEDEFPNSDIKAPYVIVGDEAFPLKTFIMRLFPGHQLDDRCKRIFNYRLSRARRTVENAFGILTQKFRLYNRRIACKPENVDYIILATCVLYNFIRKNESFECMDIPNASTSQATGLENLAAQDGNPGQTAFSVREKFKNYFVTDGAVSWQPN